ncbi:hypothetical protein OIU84_028132 [Salix udensis]|uniref:Uncharacterized protein n=1 Tax=Salix udensis TaxID=889485 RepID=A0AAD6KE94_9ROSI|nr:hypothetical protein OIU84_028132 [Salix udensis]
MVLLPWKGIEPGIVSSYKQVTRVKQNKMISAKKLIKLARKWQKLAAIGRKRITLPHPFERTDARKCSISSTTEKGHFVVYSTDQKRFLLPLKYLNSNIVRDLLKIAEEEFGLPSDGPSDITM